MGRNWNWRLCTKSIFESCCELFDFYSNYSNMTNLFFFQFARVVSQLTCTIRFPNSVTENTICLEGAQVNFCNGDFGGPLTIQDADTITTQIGVKSFLTTLGCTFGFPGGFTRVSRYLELFNILKIN
jgi:secreted trypsin-like serine protease